MRMAFSVEKSSPSNLRWSPSTENLMGITSGCISVKGRRDSFRIFFLQVGDGGTIFFRQDRWFRS